MKDAALKLALDALEEAQTNDDGMEKWDRNKKAITAIKAALAQQADHSEQHLDMVKAQSEQEIDVWPFPPATGAVPWTKQQEKAYEQQKQEQLPAAPF